MKTVKFYTKGKYMGFQEMHPRIILEVISWITSGNDIKIGDTLINDPIVARRTIYENTK